MSKLDINSLNLTELRDYLTAAGEKPFRAEQIYSWLHVHTARGFDEMTNISKSLRERLEGECEIISPVCIKQLRSKIDGTMKFLFGLRDGAVIESVFMRYHHGDSVCVSTQVGCRMGCKFCASTLNGVERNLTVSEMLGQAYEIEKITGGRVSNVVLMGSGEPLDNYDNVVKFIKMISDENGKNISRRNITLSTCGLVPEMRKLADEKLQITLALSLHAASDNVRKELMPIAKKYSIAEVLDACEYYYETTGRRVTFEYSLAAGVNDKREDAERLSLLLKGMNCHLNLIPVNPVVETNLSGSSRQTAEAFKNVVAKYGINVTIRREMGRDIAGACGQLRRGYYDN